MRVIAGKARSLSLKTLPTDSTRPTTDKTKETLFNVLQPYVVDSVFLDLFSGSGAIGIEALSRGALRSYFIESNPKAISCIKDNLLKTKLNENAYVCKSDSVNFIEGTSLNNEDFIDIIFMDPPYEKGLEEQVMRSLSNKSYVTEDTIIVIEASLKTNFEYLEALGFEAYKIKKYKTNQHVFIRKAR